MFSSPVFSRPWSLHGKETSVGAPSFVAKMGLWDDHQAAAAERIEVELREVDLVRVAFCDPHGLVRSKTVPAAVFPAVLRNGMDFSAGPFVFDTGHNVAVDFLSDAEPGAGVGVSEIAGAGDFVLVPDPRTFQVLPGSGTSPGSGALPGSGMPPGSGALPGAEPRTAWVLGDEYLRDGTVHPLASRSVLRRVCARYAGRDLAPVIGLEVEWYLTRLLPGPPGNAGNGFGLQGPAPSVAAMNAGYQFNSDGYYDSVAPVADPLAAMLMGLGLPLRSMEHESGPGQLETTFSPMLALDAADAMLLFRAQVKQFCARRGYHASFMTLPRVDGFDPSGWHLHQSVASTKTDTNVFAADGGGRDVISPDAAAYIGGLLARAREFCLLSVPTVNGYHRIAPRFTLSPTSADWRFEDRSAMVRVIGSGGSTHVENRIGEPCANPYLAIASQLSAGLDGLSAGPDGLSAGLDDPDGLGGGEGSTGGEGSAGGDAACPKLPRSLGEALEAFRLSDHAERLLGSPLMQCLIKLKESELTRFDGQFTPGEVTEWEQREYFRDF